MALENIIGSIVKFQNFWEQFIATILGVFLALYLERYVENRKRIKKVNKIASFIYFELVYNLNIVTSMRSNHKPEMFYSDFWDIYKEEISFWSPQNVAHLQIIYRKISELEQVDWERMYAEDIWSIYDEKLLFIENEIKKMLKWYDENEGLHKSILNARKEYEEMELSYGLISDLRNYSPKFDLP